MYPDSPYAHPRGSFIEPLQLLLADPQSPEFVCVQFNRTYLPFIQGCLKQGLLQSTWASADPAEITTMQERIFTLMGLFQDDLETCFWQHTFDFKIDPYDRWWGGPPAASGYGTQWYVGTGWEPITDPTESILFALNAVLDTYTTVTRIEFIANDAAHPASVSIQLCSSFVPLPIDCSVYLTDAWGVWTRNDLFLQPIGAQNRLTIVGPGQVNPDDAWLEKLIISGTGIDPFAGAPT